MIFFFSSYAAEMAVDLFIYFFVQLLGQWPDQYFRCLKKKKKSYVNRFPVPKNHQGLPRSAEPKKNKKNFQLN